MKKILIFSFCYLMFSCDPMDDRLNIYNTTSDTLVVRMMFDSELPNSPRHWNRSREVTLTPSKEYKIGIFNKWEGEFKRALPDTLINIIVVPYYDFENNPRKWDSIYNSKKYYVKRISLKEMKDQNWLIEYPNDGFTLPLE